MALPCCLRLLAVLVAVVGVDGDRALTCPMGTTVASVTRKTCYNITSRVGPRSAQLCSAEFGAVWGEATSTAEIIQMQIASTDTPDGAYVGLVKTAGGAWEWP
eukprot:Sspe_Gene.119918::Locus_117216_Transcript_2_2_Confidence_0.800_Length_359::g.119918::m.119918